MGGSNQVLGERHISPGDYEVLPEKIILMVQKDHWGGGPIPRSAPAQFTTKNDK